MIEQAQFLSTVYLYSKFKLEDIYSGVNFCRKNCVVIFICEFILIIFINLNSFIIITFLTRC